ERVREVLNGDIAGNGTRAVAVYACKPADLLEVLSLSRPVESRVVLDRTPFVEPLVRIGMAERWCVLLATRRLTRLFVGDGDELGAAGIPAVLAALNQGRVEALLVAPGLSVPGFCDPATGLLYATLEEAPGEVEPVGDVVERAIEKALEQSAEVIGVRHHDDLGPLGGTGAVLRY